jgi:hypothetical protein
MTEQKKLEYRTVHCQIINSDVRVYSIGIIGCDYFDGELGRNKCTRTGLPCKVYDRIPSGFSNPCGEHPAQTPTKRTERRPTLTRTQESLDEEARWAEAREAEQEPFPLFSG